MMTGFDLSDYDHSLHLPEQNYAQIKTEKFSVFHENVERQKKFDFFHLFHRVHKLVVSITTKINKRVYTE